MFEEISQKQPVYRVNWTYFFKTCFLISFRCHDIMVLEVVLLNIVELSDLCGAYFYISTTHPGLALNVHSNISIKIRLACNFFFQHYFFVKFG